MGDTRYAVAVDARVRAVEKNHEAFLLAMGRAGGGEERHDRRIHWVIGGAPVAYHNAVVRADLSPTEADAEIEASLDAMRRHGVPGSWHVGPAMRPADLPERLAARGFQEDLEPGMAADPAALGDQPPTPQGLTIEAVRTVEDLAVWEGVLGRGFGEGPPEAAWVASAFRRMGLSEETPWRHFLGRLEGEPAATASLFLTEDAAGIYFVSTVPERRRLGIGAAITHSAVRDAAALERRLSVLDSSPMGRGCTGSSASRNSS